jgi:hypothetical protein
MGRPVKQTAPALAHQPTYVLAYVLAVLAYRQVVGIGTKGIVYFFGERS